MSGVADEATNAGSGSQSLTVQYDGTGPGVTIALATGYTAPVNGAFGVTFTFDEPVNTFTEADVSVTNGRASTPTGSGASYTATITPAADGDVIVRVDLTGVTDRNGNAGVSSQAFTVNLDVTYPTQRRHEHTTATSKPKFCRDVS